MMDGISGLQSLISRGMHGPSQKASIPPGLQALIQAQQALKQTAIPVTPAGTPTVAGQAEQAIQQQLQPSQPQMAQPQGMPGMMPSDPFREQLMKTLQMQAQQQMQPPGGGQPPEQPQQPPQPMAAGGIAGLPADNMARMEQYAHGGVIGFDGEDGSEVPKTQQQEDRESIVKALKALQEKALLPAGAAIADVATAIPRGLAGAYNSTIVRAMRAAGLPAGYIPDVYGGDFSSATPFYDRLVRGADTNIKPMEELAATPSPGETGAPTPPNDLAAAMEVLKAKAGKQKPVASATQSGAKQSGIAVPTLEDIYKRSDVLAGTNPKIQEIEDLNKKILDLQQQRPDLESQGIEALRAHEQQRKALLDKQRQGDIWNKITSYGKDLYERGSGNRLDKTISAIDARDKADIDASLLSKQMELKLMDLAHQQKVGNLEGAQKRAKEVADLYEKRQQHLNNIVGYGAQIGTGVYSAQMTERTHAAEMAMRAKEHQLSREMSDRQRAMSLLENINREIGPNKQKLVTQMADKLDAPSKQALMLGELEGAKPEAVAKAREIRQQLEQRAEEAIKPLEQQRQMLLNQLGMANWGQVSVTPNR